MSDAMPTEEELLRRALFVPAETKEHLHTWIMTYLGLNFPDTIVDEDSNTTPMQMIWEIYRKAIDNNDPDFSTVMVYASRDSFKTLGASVLEVLAVVHMNRDCAHMAAIRPQAQKAMSYIKQFFRMPLLRDFVLKSNTEKIEILRYYNEDTGESLSQIEFAKLMEHEKLHFIEIARYIKIVICTMQGANSEHVPFFVVDEVDVIPKQNQAAYQESKSIPAPFGDLEPITVMTSTRKFSFGMVQRELDNADKSGLIIRHWNIIDVAEPCPESRHLPEEPRIPIWRSDELLNAVSDKEYQSLAPMDQKDYVLDEGFAGCLKNCKLFAACKGRLATHQKKYARDSKGRFIDVPRPMLKSLTFVTNQFKKVSPDYAKAQLLCKKPSTEGLIYWTINPEKHVISPGAMAKKLTGQDYPDHFGRGELIALMQARGVQFVAGVDFGFTHNFSIVLMAIDGQRAFVIGAWSKPNQDPAEKIELMDQTIKDFDPVIFPDTEAPDMIRFMKKRGYRAKEWSKEPGSVLSGIEAVRLRLHPSVGEPNLYFLSGDDGVAFLVQRLRGYHWALGVDGKLSKDPDENTGVNDAGEDCGDDECDALRYAIMNTFKNKGKVTAPPDEIKLPTPTQMVKAQKQPEKTAWAAQILEHALGRPKEVGEPDGAVQLKGRKGNSYWDL